MCSVEVGRHPQVQAALQALADSAVLPAEMEGRHHPMTLRRYRVEQLVQSSLELECQCHSLFSIFCSNTTKSFEGGRLLLLTTG